MSIEKAEALLDIQPTGRMGVDQFTMTMGPWIVKALRFLLIEYIKEQREKRKIL